MHYYSTYSIGRMDGEMWCKIGRTARFFFWNSLSNISEVEEDGCGIINTLEIKKGDGMQRNGNGSIFFSLSLESFFYAG